jgi:porphobilinogen synthase
MAQFPVARPRRLRRSETLRRLVRETRLSPDQLVLPLFCTPGKGVRTPISSMPGVARLSPDQCAAAAKEAKSLGLGGVILFGIPATKDDCGTSGIAADGITDVCLCEYTDHGHCGILRDGEVDNDATLPLLAAQAVSHAKAGADIVAPSDMMDGRVAAIRCGLDEAGLALTPILSYAAKYSSSFYGPFREAAGSAPKEGDRKGYQMDYANVREALREVALDVEEGADLIMVKPALSYLDVIAKVREAFDLPLWAYSVGGEYVMVKAAAERGWIDGERAMMESLLSIRRAGADTIITYFAVEAAKALAK